MQTATNPPERTARTPQPPVLVTALAVCLLLPLVAAAASPPAPLGKRQIEPFYYQGVTLEPGPLKDQVDEVRRFYLAIPDDDLLKGFRARAGLPAPGKDLGGWYSSDTFL